MLNVHAVKLQFWASRYIRCASTAGNERHGVGETAQNPIGNLISLPFQNNTNFNVGPAGCSGHPQHQPVIPISVNAGEHRHAHHRAGDFQSARPGMLCRQWLGRPAWLLSPAQPGSDLGRRRNRPYSHQPGLGSDNSAQGRRRPADKGDPWVIGALANNVWSTGTNPMAPAYVNGLISRSSTTISRQPLSHISAIVTMN